MLQSKTCALLKAGQQAKVVKTMFQNERNDEEVWNAYYEKSVEIAADVGIQPSVPRNVSRQRHRPNAPADTPSSYWRINMYLPFIDHLITELTDRLLNANDRFLTQRLIPTQVQNSNLPAASCMEIYAAYQGCLDTDEATFLRECARCRTWWTDPGLQNDRPVAPDTLADTISLADEIMYPQIRRCLAILLVMPVSTATSERSFSTMRRVKTYIRSNLQRRRHVD